MNVVSPLAMSPLAQHVVSPDFAATAREPRTTRSKKRRRSVLSSTSRSRSRSRSPKRRRRVTRKRGSKRKRGGPENDPPREDDEQIADDDGDDHDDDAGPKLRIRPWQIRKLRKNSTLVMIGRRGSGKTTLLENVMYHTQNHFDVVMAFSPTVPTIEMLKQHVPNAFVFEDGADTDVMQTVLDVFKVLMQSGKPRNVLLICDDCMDSNFIRSKVIKTIGYNGRNINVTWFFCVQFLVSVPSYLRGQIDYVLAMMEPISENREKLRKKFFGVFRTQHEFDVTMRKVTRNYGALVMDSTKPAASVEECVYWYKGLPATDLPPFLMGRRCFHAMTRFCSNEATKQRSLNRSLQWLYSNDKKGSPQPAGGKSAGATTLLAKGTNRKLCETDIVQVPEAKKAKKKKKKKRTKRHKKTH